MDNHPAALNRNVDLTAVFRAASVWHGRTSKHGKAIEPNLSKISDRSINDGLPSRLANRYLHSSSSLPNLTYDDELEGTFFLRATQC